MEANELRIGNVVKVSASGEIIKAGDMNCLGIDIFDQEPKYYYNELEGVELNDEILLKCGANKLSGHEELNDHIHFALNESTALFICIDDGRGYPNDGKALYLVGGAPMGSFLCKYLHQLQNLYFALTNKELQWQ